MSTFSGLYTFDMSVLANFKALMGDTHAQILAQGWVQTADTGQTDPATIGALPAQNGTTCYAIYKPGDALTPFYVRLEFMRQLNDWPTYGVQIGSGTDGAGNLTGNVSVRRAISAALSTAGNPLYVSCSANGRMGIALNPASGDTNQQLCVSIGRAKDGTGATADGHATQIVAGYNNLRFQHTIMFSGTNAVEHQNWRAALPRPAASGTQWTVGTHLGVAWVVPMCIPYGANPSHDAGIWGSGQAFAPGTTTVVNVYGANHTYLIGRRTVDDNDFAAWLMRYE